MRIDIFVSQFSTDMFFEPIFSDLLIFSLFIVFASSVLIQLLYYWCIFFKLAFYNKKTNFDQNNPVSVIICARNEHANLKKNLLLFLEQEYPQYEVVVVNDCSDDDTEYLLRDLSEKYSHLKTVTIKENVNFFGGKKFALAVGIKSATYNNLLLTDADCWPKSNNWIREMQNNFSDKTEIVLGYSGYKQHKGFLNKLIRFDTIMIAMQYLSFSLIGKTYMGVGRNLAYKKNLFIKAKGFTSHYHIKSGDDDIFINQVATKDNTRIEISAAAQTVSEPKKTYSDWMRQKKRHLTTGRYYKTGEKFLLFMFALSNILFYGMFITLIAIFITRYSFYIMVPVFSLFILKIISQLIIFKKVMNRLQEKNLLLISPLLDIIFIFLNPFFTFSNYIVRDTRWK